MVVKGCPAAPDRPTATTLRQATMEDGASERLEGWLVKDPSDGKRGRSRKRWVVFDQGTCELSWHASPEKPAINSMTVKTIKAGPGKCGLEFRNDDPGAATRLVGARVDSERAQKLWLRASPELAQQRVLGAEYADAADAAAAIVRLQRWVRACARRRMLVRALNNMHEPVWKPNLQPDFNVRICDSFDASSLTVLRELDESNRFVQKSAESTSI